MRTRAISIRQLSPADEEAWRDLAACSIEPNPFYEADFLVPACRHLRNAKHVVLLVAEEAGRFHACLPMRPINLRSILSSPMITSWRHRYGYLGTPLVAPERGVEALASILTTLRGASLWPRVVVLELFGDGGPIAAYLRRASDELGLTVHTLASGQRGVFRCRDGKPDALPVSSKSEWQKKARQWRRLCGDLGDPSVVDRAGGRDSAANFLAMEAASWKGKAGTALASRAGDAAFYREVTSRFGASGRLRQYSLETGGKALAMQTDLSASDGLFTWKIAYDERFASYAPGAQLLLRVYDLAKQDGLGWIDSCASVKDEHQLRLSAGRRPIDVIAIGGNGRTECLVTKLAIPLLTISSKLRVLSAATLQYKLIDASRSIGKALAEETAALVRQHPALFRTADKVLRHYGRVV
jgi:CelD/BcsL family acetyltransferase involved in cellulose biosynthesis